MACSVAMAAGIELEELLRRVGHDGSEIVHPALREPLRRRGFHIEELLLAVANDFTFIPISPEYGMTPDGIHAYYGKHKPEYVRMISESKGVVLGLSIANGYGHCCAFDGDKLYDPNGSLYDYGTGTPVW